MLYFIFSALIVLLDQVFKYYISSIIEYGDRVKLIPGVIHLTYVENTGAAFGLFTNIRWVLVAVSGVCVIFMILVMIHHKMTALGRVGLAMVLGGAVGNLIDRAAIGYVVDMFELEFFRFAVFNIADVFIVVGGILFVIFYASDIARDSRVKKLPVPPEHTAATEGESSVPESDWMFEDMPDTELTETQILEEFDLRRRMSEYDSDD